MRLNESCHITCSTSLDLELHLQLSAILNVLQRSLRNHATMIFLHQKHSRFTAFPAEQYLLIAEVRPHRVRALHEGTSWKSSGHGAERSNLEKLHGILQLRNLHNKNKHTKC